jgi:hypothetical protein
MNEICRCSPQWSQRNLTTTSCPSVGNLFQSSYTQMPHSNSISLSNVPFKPFTPLTAATVSECVLHSPTPLPPPLCPVTHSIVSFLIQSAILCCLLELSVTAYIHPDEGSDTFLRNVASSNSRRASHPSRRNSSCWLLSKLTQDNKIASASTITIRVAPFNFKKVRPTQLTSHVDPLEKNGSESFILKMEAICSSETLVLKSTTLRCHIPEGGILHSHRRENPKSYIALTGWTLKRRGNVSPVRYQLGFLYPIRRYSL